jgi:hypothetical protein
MFLLLLPPSSSRRIINHVESLTVPWVMWAPETASRLPATITPSVGITPESSNSTDSRVQALVPTLARQTEQVCDREFVRPGIWRCKCSVIIRRGAGGEGDFSGGTTSAQAMIAQLRGYNGQRPGTAAMMPGVNERNGRFRTREKRCCGYGLASDSCYEREREEKTLGRVVSRCDGRKEIVRSH